MHHSAAACSNEGLRVTHQAGMAGCPPSRLGLAGLIITAAVQLACKEHPLAALSIMTQDSLWTIGFHWLTTHRSNDWCQLLWHIRTLLLCKSGLQSMTGSSERQP